MPNHGDESVSLLWPITAMKALGPGFLVDGVSAVLADRSRELQQHPDIRVLDSDASEILQSGGSILQ